MRLMTLSSTSFLKSSPSAVGQSQELASSHWSRRNGGHARGVAASALQNRLEPHRLLDHLSLDPIFKSFQVH